RRRGSVHCRSQEIPVTVLGHPLGTCQVTLPGALGTLGLLCRIDAQHDPCYFGPVRALGIRIEEAEISDEMLLIVTSQDITLGSLVVYGWVGRRLAHVRRCSLDWLHNLRIHVKRYRLASFASRDGRFKNSYGLTLSTSSSFPSMSTVAEFSSRSSIPTYLRLMPARSASSSCDSPFERRSLRKFLATISRKAMRRDRRDP